MPPIDRNRGAEIRKYGNGARCVQYMDAPGVYVDENNKPVPDSVAKQAGFDVSADRKRAARSKTQSAMMERLSQKFSEAESVLSELPQEEREQIQLKQLADKDRYILVDKDGNRLVDLFFTFEEAVGIWEEVVGATFPGAVLTEGEEAETKAEQEWNEGYSVPKIKKFLDSAEIDYGECKNKPDFCLLAAKALGTPEEATAAGHAPAD